MKYCFRCFLLYVLICSATDLNHPDRLNPSRGFVCWERMGTYERQICIYGVWSGVTKTGDMALTFEEKDIYKFGCIVKDSMPQNLIPVNIEKMVDSFYMDDKNKTTSVSMAIIFCLSRSGG